MSQSLSMDLCKRIASVIERAEESHILIALQFSVSVSTIERISRKIRKGRQLDPAPRPGRTKVLQEHQHKFLRTEIQTNSYVTSLPLARVFNARFRSSRVHRSTILRAMREWGFRFRKTAYAPQRDRPEVVEERKLFAAQQSQLDPLRPVFIDESGCHPGLGPLRGWAPRSQALFGPEQRYARGQHVSMIVALTLNGIEELMTVDGGVKTRDFVLFVVHRPLPVLRPGDIVVWDNINLHKNPIVIDAIEKVGAIIFRLSRYGPDMNPIEAVRAKAKRWIRKLGRTTVTELKSAMRRARRRLRASDAAGWMRYCGYAPQLLCSQHQPARAVFPDNAMDNGATYGFFAIER